MASISTLGVGSGLDLSSILDSLEAAEKIYPDADIKTAKLLHRETERLRDAEKCTREFPDSQHSTE